MAAGAEVVPSDCWGGVGLSGLEDVLTPGFAISGAGYLPFILTFPPIKSFSHPPLC